MKKRHAWIARHIEDKHVKLSKKEGWRSRAAYKLLAIQKKDQFLKPGHIVLDLGAAPGAWSQVAIQQVGCLGLVFAIDQLPILPLKAVKTLQGNLLEEKTLQILYGALGQRKVDSVLSDMAPNLSGMKSIDQPRSNTLMQTAFEIVQTVLKIKGNFLVKCFQGVGFDQYFQCLSACFEKVLVRKPDASRSCSSEVYLMCKNYRKPSD